MPNSPTLLLCSITQHSLMHPRGSRQGRRFYKVYLDSNYPTVLPFTMLARRPTLYANSAPFLFNHFGVAPSQPSICNSRVFITLRVAPPATPFFSQPSALPGWPAHASTHCPPTTTHCPPPLVYPDGAEGPLPLYFQSLGHSLSPIFVSRPLFSRAYALFAQIPGGGGHPASLLQPIFAFRLRFSRNQRNKKEEARRLKPTLLVARHATQNSRPLPN